jgi:hypothetical protein
LILVIILKIVKSTQINKKDDLIIIYEGKVVASLAVSLVVVVVSLVVVVVTLMGISNLMINLLAILMVQLTVHSLSY